MTCLDCLGRGYILLSREVVGNNIDAEWCPRCDGTGTDPLEEPDDERMTA